MEQIVGVAQLYFMPHPLLEIVQRLMAHPVHSCNFMIPALLFYEVNDPLLQVCYKP